MTAAADRVGDGFGHGAGRDGDLLPLVDRLDGTVLTVGDLMLDVFAYGSIARISPEAPVPVLHLASEKRMLGGVGNVARNVAALGGRATLLSPVGTDETGRSLRRLLGEDARISGELVADDLRPTSVKTRFVASGQQVLRADLEEVGPIAAAVETRLLDRFDALIGQGSALIVSDYGKGVLTPRVLGRILAVGAERGIPIIVDPKHRDLRVYRGATCITPNLAELALATGMPVGDDPEVVAAARLVIEQTGAAFVLVTRSEKGMSLVGRDGSVLHLPAHRREVFDVSGAGDTVVATLALALASGIGWPDATALANVAAGIVVSKQGTATCSRAELEAELGAHLLAQDSKLKSRRDAAFIAAQWKRQGLKVGFTNGCFDLLHPGHVQVLQRSRERCDRLVVGLNSDASVKRYKGPTRPLQDEDARATVLSALAAVDMVVIFDEDTPRELIETLRPGVLLKGADYRLEEVVGAESVLADGGEVLLVDLVAGQSTTNIIKKMGR